MRTREQKIYNFLSYAAADLMNKNCRACAMFALPVFAVPVDEKRKGN